MKTKMMEYFMAQSIGKMINHCKKVIAGNSIIKLLSAITFLSILLIGCSGIPHDKDRSIVNKLIISSFSSNSEGSISEININDNSVSNLIDNKQVAVTGDTNKDTNKIVYVDALGDSDPWQIYLNNKDSNNSVKITNDSLGKSHPKLSDDNYIYFLTAPDKNIVKIGYINPDNKQLSIIDKNSDIEVNAFNVKGNKIIMATDDDKLRLEKWNENKGINVPMIHSIWESDFNGDNVKKILDIQALSIQSISYNYDGNDIIIGGIDINGDSGLGIYKISLKSGNIEKLLDNDLLSKSNLSYIEITNLVNAVVSKNEDLVYFTAISKKDTMVNIAGLNSYPSSIFSYNMKTNEVKEVFVPSTPSLIFDLNIKY